MNLLHFYFYIKLKYTRNRLVPWLSLDGIQVEASTVLYWRLKAV